jgi:hypothetical protein
LKDATFVAAAASATLVGDAAFADEDGMTIEILDLDVKPLIASHGAVVIPGSNATFATFATNGGTALIEFTRCAVFKFRSSGDDANAAHSLDLDSLAPCETYEVANSPWAVKQSVGKTDFRHFVITFLGDEIAAAQHFECLAEDVHAQLVSSGSYLDMVDYAAMVG